MYIMYSNVWFGVVQDGPPIYGRLENRWALTSIDTIATPVATRQNHRTNLPGLVNVYKKLLKMAIEIVSFPINSMVDLSSSLC